MFCVLKKMSLTCEKNPFSLNCQAEKDKGEKRKRHRRVVNV